MRPTHRWVLSVGIAIALGAPSTARPQPLPELSGRAINPADDPRLARKARQERAARRGKKVHELRRRSRPRLRSVRLRNGGWRFIGAGWSADVGPDGSLSFNARKASWSTRKMQVSFDVTDAVMRAKGQDPYAAEKLRFMRQTFAWRLRLKRAARRRARQSYFAGLPGRLRALWRRTDLSTLRKRGLLFELWEECLEPGNSALAVQAQQARWMILRFIQKHLPAASPHAFTKRELRWMQKRRKGLPAFDPYGRLKRPRPPTDTGR